ncbi:MAG: DUF4157 domain-containing protein [Kofleriaceae bacterium]
MERELSRAQKSSNDHDDEQHRRGGKHKPSSEMTAPEHPVVSGLVSRKADGNGVRDGAEDAVARASSSSGMSLPGTLMRKFESSLGADLSNVRVHTGGESQAAAGAVGAKAYTVGQDIHFGAGQYDPSSGAGEHLLAHEVAHTVQQQGGTPTRQNKMNVSTPFDAAESEADTAADAMVAGRSASVTSAGGVQRKSWGTDPQGEDRTDADGQDVTTPKPFEMGEWVVNDDSDPSFSGEQDSHETEITEQQKRAALDQVAPSLPSALKIAMLGQLQQEQSGKKIQQQRWWNRRRRIRRRT